MIENRRIVLQGLVYTLVPVIIEGPMIYYTTWLISLFFQIPFNKYKIA